MTIDEAKKHYTEAAMCKQKLSGWPPYWIHKQNNECGKKAHWLWTSSLRGEIPLCTRHAKNVGLKKCKPIKQQKKHHSLPKPNESNLVEKWTSIKESLPPFLTPVLLLNTGRHMSFGPYGNWKGVGVLNGEKMFSPYWSVIGEDSGLVFEEVTHWMLIPKEISTEYR